MDILSYVMAKNAAATDLAAAIAALPNGLVYKGAVNYYSNLPANPEIGDAYTVKYKGTSGSVPNGKEVVWGTYEGTDQWIELGGSDLPSIGPNDEGKVLKVHNGVWTSQTQTGELYTVEFEIDEPTGNNTYSLTTRTTLADIWEAVGKGCNIRATLEFPGAGIIVAPLVLIVPDESSQDPDGELEAATFSVVGYMGADTSDEGVDVSGMITIAKIVGESEASFLMIDDISNRLQPREILYEYFVELIENNMLIPGRKYRITDYVTKCNGTYNLSALGQAYQGFFLPYATSAEHPFDLIVEATGTNTYDNHVKAVCHAGDGYFNPNSLSKWELMWTHDNNAFQYSWADANNGKGVITWMRDENNNDAPYDFKNIMFLQVALTRIDSNDARFACMDYPTTSSLEIGWARYGSPGDVMLSLLQNTSTLPQNLKFGFHPMVNVDVGEQQMLCSVLMLTISDVTQTGLSAGFDWENACLVLSAILEVPITTATLSALFDINQSDLESMTTRDVIRVLLNADFYYTFDLVDPYDDIAHPEWQHSDYSNIYIDASDLWAGTVCFNNHISAGNDQLSSFSMDGNGGPYANRIMRGLPIVTFQNSLSRDDEEIVWAPCWGNVIGTNTHIVIGGSGCFSNTVGDDGLVIRLGTGSNNNRLGNDNMNVALGSDSNSNTIGVAGTVICLDEDCHSNTISDHVIGLTIAKRGARNHIACGCDGVSLEGDGYGNGCDGVTVGSAVLNCSFVGWCYPLTVQSSVSGVSVSQNTAMALLPSGLSYEGFECELTHYGSSNGYHATLIIRLGYGQEYAFTTTDGGQTWTPVTTGFVSFTNSN